MLSVTIEYTNGQSETAKDGFNDLFDATSFALNLANTLGEHNAAGRELLCAVLIMQSNIVELSIAVIQGGLLGGTRI